MWEGMTRSSDRMEVLISGGQMRVPWRASFFRREMQINVD
jgi:hypothetical protein